MIGEKITVTRRYFGKGSVQTLDCRIEGVRHEYTAAPFRWATTFRLSPGVDRLRLSVDYWRSGTSTLGTNTVPVW